MLFDVENTARLVMLVLYVIKVCADMQGSMKLYVCGGGGVGVKVSPRSKIQLYFFFFFY